MTPTLFGILQLDQGEPNGFAEFVPLVQSWLQDAGGFAALGLAVYLAYALFHSAGKSESYRIRTPIHSGMVLMLILSVVCYAVVLLTFFLGGPTVRLGNWSIAVAEPPQPIAPVGATQPVERPTFRTELRPLLLMAGGAFALIGILQPLFWDLFKLRGRRIYALSKLVFKQASGMKALWVTFIFVGALPFLFPAQWFVSVRPEDELKVTISFVSVVAALLILFIAALLASFSLPNDIKNQTIYTVVTKPVERFEIVLGLFFGFTTLMTLVLTGLTLVSLLLIRVNSVNAVAAEQTFKARVPIRGELEFRSRNERFQGDNVGREFEYRKYIRGHPLSPQRAIWNFDALPSDLVRAENDRVPVEFTFDIYRLTKGSEDRGGSGVEVGIRFVTHNCPQRKPDPIRESLDGEWHWVDTAQYAAYTKELQQLRDQGRNPTAARPGTDGWKAANELAEKYGIYEISGKPVTNNRVIGVDIPAGLFRNALRNPPKDPATPLFQVYVKCESAGQMLGMAEPDLYLLAGTKSFTQNFIKSMFGLWCWVCLVTGLAVACSTYLSGVISFLATAFLFICGFFTDLIRDLSLNRNVGGGAADSFAKLLRAELPTAPTGDGTGVRVVQFLDLVFAWVMRRFQNLVPDVEAFAWTDFVKEGFNISFEYLILNFVGLIGYLLPWGILAYYLMKSREIASS